MRRGRKKDEEGDKREEKLEEKVSNHTQKNI